MSAAEDSQVDLLIKARWVIPMVPGAVVYPDHAVAVRDRRIVALCPAAEAAAIEAVTTVELPHHALLPGLVNAHGHAPMTLLRGAADDIPLKQWLEEHIWPLESRFVNRDFVHHGAELAIAEMILSGTTCFADMYFFPDEVARAALDAHLRVQLASPILDFATVWAQDADEYLAKATRLHDDFRSSELVYTAFGPHAPYTVSDGPLTKLGTLAEELDIPIHMHVHETAQEVEAALASDGRRPLQRLQQLGLVSPRLLCVHATQLSAEEIELLAHQGASVIHCPRSNMKLASGFCEVSRLLQQGVNVALGSDGAASNNDLDMFAEMRSGALLAKAVAADASALPAWQALEMATINGARALGLEELIGSLEPGKFADLIAVDLERFNSLPLYHPLSHLVYACQSSQVSHSWCGGEALLADGQLLRMDTERLTQRALQWQQRIGAAMA